MKRTQLFVVSVLALGLQGVAHATYPSDAEASFNLPALQTSAERHAGVGDRADVWGVSMRAATPHNAFPFGGGYIDD